jgi:hypothetical protein
VDDGGGGVVDERLGELYNEYNGHGGHMAEMVNASTKSRWDRFCIVGLWRERFLYFC